MKDEFKGAILMSIVVAVMIFVFVIPLLKQGSKQSEDLTSQFAYQLGIAENELKNYLYVMSVNDKFVNIFPSVLELPEFPSGEDITTNIYSKDCYVKTDSKSNKKFCAVTIKFNKEINKQTAKVSVYRMPVLFKVLDPISQIYERWEIPPGEGSSYTITYINSGMSRLLSLDYIFNFKIYPTDVVIDKNQVVLTLPYSVDDDDLVYVKHNTDQNKRGGTGVYNNKETGYYYLVLFENLEDIDGEVKISPKANTLGFMISPLELQSR